MSYYTALLALVSSDTRQWYRTNPQGETTAQPPFVVVRVALAEYRHDARRVITEGRFTSPTAVYERR